MNMTILVFGIFLKKYILKFILMLLAHFLLESSLRFQNKEAILQGVGRVRLGLDYQNIKKL